MRVVATALSEVLIVEPRVFTDPRGFFFESFHAERYAAAGIGGPFVQDNHSSSCRATLRGLHAQLARPQGKLVRVIAGEVFDVAADMRRGSPTFGRWVGVTLSAANHRQLWIPPGFLHGFQVVSEQAEVEYKCTAFYQADDQFGVAWDDPELGIAWPLAEPVLSGKDAAAPRLAEVMERLPAYDAWSSSIASP